MANNKRELLQCSNIGFLTIENPHSKVSEAFKTLRTRVKFHSQAQHLRCILFTSATSAEGKSFVLANLAVTLAKERNKVIIVDADLRNPMQQQYFSVDHPYGLTTFVNDNVGLDKVLVDTGIDRLTLLPSGPIPDEPSELLGSARMKELMYSLREMYDVVLVDTPAILSVTDAAEVSRLVDGVVLIVRAGKASREAVAEAKRRLQSIKAKFLGAVLNDFHVEQNRSNYYFGG